MAGLRDQTVRAKLEDDGERDCPHHRHGAPHGTPRRLPSAALPSSLQPSLPHFNMQTGCSAHFKLAKSAAFLVLFKSKRAFCLRARLAGCVNRPASRMVPGSFLSSGDSKVVRVVTTDGQWLGQGAAARREGGSGSAYARAPETPSGVEHLRVRGKKSRRGRLRSCM